ncbi:non-ribosomal peptide synthetase [Micromonospora coxensis]|uniref:Amino acid adenylation domain-containing protein n=1 Tax=Micromonospora coxensis TaxID=356852 RepID=A0A1C5JZL3_9ACTN|nr:non-ribosomal peptide synthetase [Micromonospora coxensis]SCG75982.1 amino acid adenylation domain-containing protein [Micromonospora coxensis]
MTAGTEQPFALAPAQERLWFLHRLDPTDTAYHMFFTLRLRGDVDVAALSYALRELTRRHEPLRTRYTELDGVATGLVAAVGRWPLHEVDLSGTPDPPSAADAAVRQDLERPFDLSAAAPLRATLYRLAAGEHVLSLVLHHIAGDGWSLTVLGAELTELYNAARGGRPPALPTLSARYRDYAAYARQRAAADRDFWRDRLAGAARLDLTGLATDTDAPASAGAFHPVPLAADVVPALRELARAQRATMFLVLLTAFQVLLARHSGQRDLCVAAPLAGRDRSEFEPLIGYLSNTVLLRADLGDDPTFADLLRRNRNDLFTAYAHPGLPFEELGANAPFDALFVLDNPAAPTATFDGLHAQPVATGLRQAKTPVTLEALDLPDGCLRLLLGHQLRTCDEATGQQLAHRLGRLLTAAAHAPQQRVTRLAMLTPDESARLVAAGRGRRPEQPAPDVMDLILAQAAATADATALIDGDDEVSYAALAARTEALAIRLRACGAGPGTTVAVRGERGAQLVVELLAVLRAGAAYTCLDPADPPARHDVLIAGSGATLLLDAGRITQLPGPAGPAPDRAVPPLELAYLCHTSGSTGAPKAVMLTRQAVAARVRWMAREYQLGPGDRVLQFASLSFDTHVEEILPALAGGATVVLGPQRGELLPDFLSTPLAATLTVLDLPTSYWHELTMRESTRWPPALRLLIIGGEAAHAAAVSAWRRAVGPRVRLVNTYGPTEATVIATAVEVTDAHDDPPIGLPLDDTDAHVLDRHLMPVPPGVPGQLYLGGAGLARGYRGAPGQTARRFVPDPFGPPGARLYATGDRVRRTADGMLHFLGRTDDQVKIRGYRIEPAEVERHLMAEPEVRAAAVTVRDQALVAWVVADLADPGVLRARLTARLPDRLVPAHVVALAQLPLTSNGKVDRAALARTALPAPLDAAGHVPPRDDAEQLVADVWSEVLGHPTIGASDDFFALGGHSLHALRVAARLADAIEVEVPLRLLFEHRTVAQLAARITALVLADIEQAADGHAPVAAGKVGND